MWNNYNPEYVKLVKTALEEIGHVCPRCVLRLAGVKNSRELREAEEVLPQNESDEKENGKGPPEKKLRIDDDFQTCRACLGALQEQVMQPALEKVCREVCSAGYDANHFTIAVSLPVSLTMRNHSLTLYLEEKVSSFDYEQVVPIKQVWKWLFPQRIEKSVGKNFVSGESCEFYAELQLQHADEESDTTALQSMCAEEYAMRAKKHRKYHMGLVTRQGAEKSLADVSIKEFRVHYPVPPSVAKEPVTAAVKMYHNSIFLAGRYNKFSRELPQTPWLVDGVRKMDTSVEELITEKLKDCFSFDCAKFSSSGREDVDVRTLGLGRPFLIEITNPRKTFFSDDDFALMERRINESTDKIKILHLRVIPKQNVKLLKEGEDQKRKTYVALCIAPSSPFLSSTDLDKLTSLKNVELMQKTPVRVLHRRPNATRSRTVYEMRAESISDDNMKYFSNAKIDVPQDRHNLFRLTLSTQAGTYVKEFVHGDFGRTSPNLREILQIPDLDILALDVMAIDLEWPPGISDKIDWFQDNTTTQSST